MRRVKSTTGRETRRHRRQGGGKSGTGRHRRRGGRSVSSNMSTSDGWVFSLGPKAFFLKARADVLLVSRGVGV